MTEGFNNQSSEINLGVGQTQTGNGDQRVGGHVVRRINGTVEIKGGTEEENKEILKRLDEGLKREPDAVTKSNTVKQEPYIPSREAQIRAGIETARRNEASDIGLSPFQRFLKWFTRFSV